MAGLATWDQRFARWSWLRSLGLVIPLLLGWSPLATAHQGPPTPLLLDHRIGPYLVSVWGHPDVGTGAFFIRLEPPPGGRISGDVAVQVGVQPLSGRLAEVRYAAEPQQVQRHVQYQAEVPFDAQELWRLRIVVQSPVGSGEATVDVEAIPPGLGRWDVLVYLFPFVALGLLGLQVRLARRHRDQNA